MPSSPGITTPVSPAQASNEWAAPAATRATEDVFRKSRREIMFATQERLGIWVERVKQFGVPQVASPIIPQRRGSPRLPGVTLQYPCLELELQLAMHPIICVSPGRVRNKETTRWIIAMQCIYDIQIVLPRQKPRQSHSHPDLVSSNIHPRKGS